MKRLSTMTTMRFFIMTIITLAVAGGIAYIFLDQQKNTQVKIEGAQQSAQEKADAYKANQAKMMKELGQ